MTEDQPRESDQHRKWRLPNTGQPVAAASERRDSIDRQNAASRWPWWMLDAVMSRQHASPPERADALTDVTLPDDEGRCRGVLDGFGNAKEGPMLESARIHPHRLGAVTLIVSALALALSACSSSGASPAPAASPGAPAASSVSPTAGNEGNHVAVWTVSNTTKAGIGPYLVAESTTGEDALTVYVFKKDVPGSGSSACDASCAKTWLPLLLEGGATVKETGVSGTLGQLTRSDSTVQVTYNGAPLYFYVGDNAAGDTNGQGVSASWSAATP